MLSRLSQTPQDLWFTVGVFPGKRREVMLLPRSLLQRSWSVVIRSLCTHVLNKYILTSDRSPLQTIGSKTVRKTFLFSLRLTSFLSSKLKERQYTVDVVGELRQIQQQQQQQHLFAPFLH